MNKKAGYRSHTQAATLWQPATQADLPQAAILSSYTQAIRHVEEALNSTSQASATSAEPSSLEFDVAEP